MIQSLLSRQLRGEVRPVADDQRPHFVIEMLHRVDGLNLATDGREFFCRKYIASGNLNGHDRRRLPEGHTLDRQHVAPFHPLWSLLNLRSAPFILRSDGGITMNQLIRLRFNTMADATPGGEFTWRVILEKDGGFEEVLVKALFLNVPSFSKTDEMPVVGRKHHMACYGMFSVRDDIGYVDPPMK
jgi:hypothetical protein